MSAISPEFGTRKARALASFCRSPVAEDVFQGNATSSCVPYPCCCRHSGVSLTTTWCPGARRRKPSSTTTGATTTTCRCGTAPTPTCWSTSASPSSVSAPGACPCRACSPPDRGPELEPPSRRVQLALPPSRLGAAGMSPWVWM